jgi:hypothetical protein
MSQSIAAGIPSYVVNAEIMVAMAELHVRPVLSSGSVIAR